MIPRLLASLLPIAALAVVPLQASPSAAERKVETPSPHGAFVEDCSLCHGPEGWRPAVISPAFDHSKRGLPLEGAHRRVACMACHAKPDFTEASSECVACHADIHRGELGPDCARCHTTSNFVERADQVRSHRTSRFPLAGAHLTLDCASCHRPASGGHLTFVNTSAECSGCHLPEYGAAKNPDHVAAGFPRDCEQCHSSGGWSGRSFNHALTGFALSGAHKGLACDECHAGGRFSRAAADCIACHQNDYDQAADPDHRISVFPTTCSDCHDMNSWLGAKFDHGRWFPIYSGVHRGEWTRCSECHASPSSYTSFTCLTCHPHSDKAKTDGDHQGEQGYVYDSLECYDCHPDGRN